MMLLKPPGLQPESLAAMLGPQVRGNPGLSALIHLPRAMIAAMEVIMRFPALALAIAAAGFATGALAMPVMPSPAGPAAMLIQLQCTPQSCIDPRTGVYTQSTCDRYGCRPSSGPVGRIGPGGGGYGYGPPPGPPPGPRYDRGYGGRDYGGGGGFDCNRSRCIDGSGRVWESTCDRRGCRPLRPARGYR